ncbi:MAG: hypothetical protein HEQ40_16390 [Lacibacter sp.]|jgi:hypothetical protein
MSELKDEWIEVAADAHAQVIQHPYHIFNAAAFTELNSSKCEEAFYLLYKDSKYRLGLTAGKRGGMLLSPFSAPFGGFSFLKQDVQIAVIEKAVQQLEVFALSKSCSAIRLILPPLIYNETFLAKQINVLYRLGYRNSNLDLDFYIPLQSGASYEELLWYNAKKNLRISQQQGFEVTVCNEDVTAQQTIYEVIRENRISKGKPMNMSWEDIRSTASVIPTDFFLLKRGDEAIAGAIVYKAAAGIRYVPFWGDRPGYTPQKPMNFLSHYIAEFYRRAGDQYLHIGISTENSVPNYGLCEFKESIGCTITPKLSFEKNI